MHRLFGEAIRAAVAATARLRRPSATCWPGRMRAPRCCGTATPRSVRSWHEALADTGSGLALWALATLQEVYSGKDSARTFGQARQLLDPPVTPEERSALADCLHASARVANNMKDAPEKVIDAGIADAQRAISLRDVPGQTADAEKARQAAIAKHEAIFALLRQRAVKFIDDPAEKVQELHQVLDLLDNPGNAARRARPRRPAR